MEAKREGNEYVVRLSMDEAHVLIWGGPTDLVGAMRADLTNTLVNVEDDAFTDDEYQEAFADLDAMYVRLREKVSA